MEVLVCERSRCSLLLQPQRRSLKSWSIYSCVSHFKNTSTVLWSPAHYQSSSDESELNHPKSLCWQQRETSWATFRTLQLSWQLYKNSVGARRCSVKAPVTWMKGWRKDGWMNGWTDGWAGLSEPTEPAGFQVQMCVAAVNDDWDTTSASNRLMSTSVLTLLSCDGRISFEFDLF